jgi:tetratricopeptide (TPR) repeat protein
MRVTLRILLIAGLLQLARAAWGAGGDSGAPSSPPDPVLEAVAAASARQDWDRAASILEKALARSPGDAEYHNLYAHALRMGPRPDMAQVFKHYGEALRLDPDHRGAHEYVGEAYLTVGNLAKAKEHLAALDRICFFGCREYSDLKREIAEYEQNHPR